MFGGPAGSRACPASRDTHATHVTRPASHGRHAVRKGRHAQARHAGTEIGPPWTRGRYETLDYFIVADRWKNSVADMESDMLANVDTDHGPVQGTAKVKLKGISRVGKLRN